MVDTLERVPHFELMDDASFWMKHSIQVLIRVRPLNEAEKIKTRYDRCLKQESAHCITWTGLPETQFTFDHVACETIDQEKLFQTVGYHIVENCMTGFNSCLMAYGQTGSGKTYTMLGDIEPLETKSSNRGMIPRVFEYLFDRLRVEEEIHKDEGLRYHCRCSFLEIYNDQINDLLHTSSKNLTLRNDTKKGMFVEKLSEFSVQSVSDVLKLLTKGSSNRKIAATNMNKESSRSHGVFTCIIELVKDSTSNVLSVRLNLVDLAGTERQKTSGAEGENLKEATNINLSLHALRNVLDAICDCRTFVPYRESKLTHLLQDSLGGNSKTIIIANVSPSLCSAAETLNTLKFANGAKLIRKKVCVNKKSSEMEEDGCVIKKNELPALEGSKLVGELTSSQDNNAEIQRDIEQVLYVTTEENILLNRELKLKNSELEKYQRELQSYKEINIKLQGDIEDLQALMLRTKSFKSTHPNIVESIERDKHSFQEPHPDPSFQEPHPDLAVVHVDVQDLPNPHVAHEDVQDPLPEPSAAHKMDDTIVVDGGCTVDRPPSPKRRRTIKKWSAIEEEALRAGVEEFGAGNWIAILNSHLDIFERRTYVDLKDKWRNLQKQRDRQRAV